MDEEDFPYRNIEDAFIYHQDLKSKEAYREWR